ncbi:MAG TPA: chromosomal replication initiator protein DnaA [Solirubrobacterales bacterium]
MQQPVPEDVAALWERVRGDLRDSLPASTFKLWLEPLRPVSAQGKTLYLSAPETVRAWVERRYVRAITEALHRHAGDDAELVLVPTGPGGASAAPAPGLAPQPRRLAEPAGSFDDFVIGSGNRFAHAAALAVAEMPGEAYNPLFLHGAPGLGKTHLLSAIAGYIRARHPERRVEYTTAEQFTADFVSSVRGAGTTAFKQRHREAYVLLVDDVQFLEQKRQTEEEFFHTFNALHEAGSQIVLSSDRPPADLSRIAERLRDRFEWGLCAELGPPDLRTRTTLLTRLARRNAPQPVDPVVIREIASRVPANVRKLEGALNRVLAYASMMGLPLDRDLVRDVLAPQGGGHRPAPAAHELTLERIQNAVCAVLHLSSDDLLGRKRSAQAVRGRQLAIHLARERLGLSLGELGHAFDRDRATILHSLRAVERDLVPESNTSATLEQVQRRLEAAEV